MNDVGVGVGSRVDGDVIDGGVVRRVGVGQHSSRSSKMTTVVKPADSIEDRIRRVDEFHRDRTNMFDDAFGASGRLLSRTDVDTICDFADDEVVVDEITMTETLCCFS